MLRHSGWVAALILALAGCNSDPSGAVPVSGTVKIDGQTVEGVLVTFVTDKHAGFGKTDASGKFSLKAQPGENKVFFSKITDPRVDDPDSGMDAEQIRMEAISKAGGDPSRAKIPELVPEELTHAETTTIKFPVPEGGSDAANFEIPARK